MSEHIIESNETLLKQCEDMYSSYGRYINKWRAFPLYEDGLKLVERRVLYTEYLNANKGKFVKSALVVGECIGKLHPHGDCLRADTVIPLLDGSKPTIKELVEKYHDKKFYVYSCDPKTLEIVPGLAHSPRVGQITDKMYRITLDNNTVVECTENHPFMTRWMDRPRYIKACDLKVGESLRSLNLGMHCDGYLYTSFNNKDIAIHKMVGEYIYGKENGYVYHHKDYNKLNNDPNNILKVTRREHVILHQKNKEFYDMAIKCLDKGRIEMFSENGKYRKKIKEKNIKLINQYNKTHIYAIDRAKYYIIDYLVKNSYEVNLENYNKYRKVGGYNVPKFENLLKRGYIKNFEELYKLCELNHKVVKIEIVKLDKPIEFYDLTVEKYHNFGIGQGIFVHNSSAYSTLVQLCNCGLSDYNGNFGTNIGLHDEPPAAMRYTEVKMNKDVVKMAFQHLEYVPFESLELPMKEPIFLATKLPFCLIRNNNYCVGIGFGFKTYIPSYKKEDLVKRLNWLLTKQGEEPIIKPVTDCDLKSTDEDYKKLLTTGEAKITYVGKCKMDKVNKCVIVNSISPGIKNKYNVILNKFKDEIQVQKSIGYIDESCGDQTKVKFVILKRGQNIEKLYETIQKLITGPVSFQCNMCDTQGNVKVVSIDQMLLRAYECYKQANIKLLESNINKCQQIIDELELVAKVKIVLPKWLKTFPDDIDKLIDGVEQDTQIKKDILKEMFEKYTIPRFTRCKTDTTDKKKQKEFFESQLKDINNFVWRLYEQL